MSYKDLYLDAKQKYSALQKGGGSEYVLRFIDKKTYLSIKENLKDIDKYEEEHKNDFDKFMKEKSLKVKELYINLPKYAECYLNQNKLGDIYIPPKSLSRSNVIYTLRKRFEIEDGIVAVKKPRDEKIKVEKSQIEKEQLEFNSTYYYFLQFNIAKYNDGNIGYNMRHGVIKPPA